MWRWEEHVNIWGRQEMHKGFWLGNLEETDRLEHMRRWKYNIKMDLKGPGWKDVDWIHTAQDKDK